MSIQGLALKRFIVHYPRRQFRGRPLPHHNVFRWGCTPSLYAFGPYDTIWECLAYTADIMPYVNIDSSLVTDFPMHKIAKIHEAQTFAGASFVVSRGNAPFRKENANTP